MKVFNNSGKINFIDKWNVFAGFDYESNCCEHYGVLLLDEDVSELTYELLDLEVDLGTLEDLEKMDSLLKDYSFDTSYHKVIEDDKVEDGGALVMKLKCYQKPDKYLVFFNCHNGYYSHSYAYINTSAREGEDVVVAKGWL